MLKGNGLTKPEKAEASNGQLMSEFADFKIGIFLDCTLSMCFVLCKKILLHGTISTVHYSLKLFAAKHYM